MGCKIADRAMESLEARLLIEPHLASLGARRHGEPAVRLARRHEPRATVPEAKFGSGFHMQLALWSGSGVFVHLLSSLIDPANPACSLINQCDRGSRSDHDHKAIYAAVVAGDAEGACAEATVHLQRLCAVLMRRPRLVDRPLPAHLSVHDLGGPAHDLDETRAGQLVKASKLN